MHCYTVASSLESPYLIQVISSACARVVRLRVNDGFSESRSTNWPRLLPILDAILKIDSRRLDKLAG